MKNYLSQIDIAPPGGLKGYGKLGLETASSSDSVNIFTKFISSTIGLITLIGIVWVVISIVTGALGIIMSGGDKAALESSRKKIANALVGLVVIVASLFILSIIGQIIGLPFILDFAVLFKNLNI